jgi:hypothetical protein
MRRLRVVLAVVLVALAGGGCRVTLSAGVEVGRDGTGVVRAGLGLDDDALAQLGDPATRLRVADLREAGWRVVGPAREADGLTWVRLSKPFRSAEEATEVAAELSGPEGPFRAFRVERSGGLVRATTRFSGVVDLRAGLPGLADPEVVALLGDDLDLDLEGLRARFGPALDEAVRVEVAADLPGVERVWRGVLGEEVVLSAEARTWNLGLVLPAAAALVLAAAAVLVLAAARRS